MSKVQFNSISEALIELRQGKPVIVVDDEQRENEGDFLCSAEKCTPETINFMTKHGRGLICVAIPKSRAEQLDFEYMVNPATNNSMHETAFTNSVDYKLGTTTGISVFDRAKTVNAIADPAVQKENFSCPGHVFPLVADNAGVFRRQGHTEAAVDLMRFAALESAGVLVEILNDDGSMARVPDLVKVAKRFKLKMITIKDLILYRLRFESRVERVVTVELPTCWGNFELVAFRDLATDDEHIALIMGEWKADEEVLVRIHSECLTGDLFGSARCDCGEQLRSALQIIEHNGKGALIYLRQEGRGIGLFNKLKTYKLQEEGLDTVLANVALGFDSDSRDYTVACHILDALNIKSVKLLTNNPDKSECLETYGIKVNESISMVTKSSGSSYLRNYLQTKKDKMGHAIEVGCVVPDWD